MDDAACQLAAAAEIAELLFWALVVCVLLVVGAAVAGAAWIVGHRPDDTRRISVAAAIGGYLLGLGLAASIWAITR